MAGEEAILVQHAVRQLAATEKLIVMTQGAAAASLASGIIAASGKPHTVEQAKAVLDDVYWTLYPRPGDGAYALWQSAKLRERAMAIVKDA